jgi:hypothetical protein
LCGNGKRYAPQRRVFQAKSARASLRGCLIRPKSGDLFASERLTKNRHEARSGNGSAECIKTRIIVVFQDGIRLLIAKCMFLWRIRLNSHEFRPSIESAPHCRNFHGRDGIRDRVRCI